MCVVDFLNATSNIIFRLGEDTKGVDVSIGLLSGKLIERFEIRNDRVWLNWILIFANIVGSIGIMRWLVGHGSAKCYHETEWNMNVELVPASDGSRFRNRITDE